MNSATNTDATFGLNTAAVADLLNNAASIGDTNTVRLCRKALATGRVSKALLAAWREHDRLSLGFYRV